MEHIGSFFTGEELMTETAITSPERIRLAMLVDGDNAQASLIKQMLAEASKYGIVSIRRVYGDWTTPSMNSWKPVLQEHAVQPIQQFRNTIGKNATDSALIIDAMDVLYSGNVEGFCIVSSDSDYTRLATRIRETGFFVLGIGNRNTPRAFVNGCEVFVFTENLTRIAETEDVSVHVDGISHEDPIPLLRRAFDLAVQDDGYAFLGSLGNYLRQLDPSFDSRTYGHKQLSMLIRDYPQVFAIREEKTASGPIHMFVRMKS
jgi:uncharacterized LabA/DUF88 family protein